MLKVIHETRVRKSLSYPSQKVFNNYGLINRVNLSLCIRRQRGCYSISDVQKVERYCTMGVGGRENGKNVWTAYAYGLLLFIGLLLIEYGVRKIIRTCTKRSFATDFMAATVNCQYKIYLTTNAFSDFLLDEISPRFRDK